MNINIRRVVPDEADFFSHIAFSAKAHWGYPPRWMEIWRPQLTFSPRYFEKSESWAAEFNGKPIAFYTLQEKNGNAWIENMWVLPEYIGKGIGKKLFLDAVSRSRQKGHLILQLESDPNAVSFYKKMGMYKIGESDYPIEGQSRILPVMELML